MTNRIPTWRFVDGDTLRAQTEKLTAMLMELAPDETKEEPK